MGNCRNSSSGRRTSSIAANEQLPSRLQAVLHLAELGRQAPSFLADGRHLCLELVLRPVDADYGIWERLVNDPEPDVALHAGYFLLGALGRRNLDLVKLLPVLEAYERQEYIRRFDPEAGEEA